MSEFLGYLERLNVRPGTDALSDSEARDLQARFDPYSAEVVVNGVPVDWSHVDEVEVVRAARERGPSGWLVRRLMGDDRYHVGLYYGANEAVLTNVSLAAAEYVVRMVAFYAPHPVRYSGVGGLSPIAFEG